MKTKKFQGGGVIDEDDLFADDVTLEGAPAGAAEPAGNLDGELAGGDGAGDPPEGEPPAGDPQAGTTPVKPALNVEPGADAEPPEGAEPPAGTEPPAGGDEPDLTNVELTGVEEFLTNYGVKGGIIEYEDGEKVKFTDLPAEEQATVLSSLVENSVPSVEEKYNLDDSEVNLLNTVRESGRSVEDFINDIVDLRVDALVTKQAASSTDLDNMSLDAVYVKHLKDNDPEITDEILASELKKAKELSTFETTVNTIKKVYTAEAAAEQAQTLAESNAAFETEVEEQRKVIVGTVEGITDVAGSTISNEVKEFLLHDVMELNENRDPILMEKIFSDPETMFKVNWFMNYGEDYIHSLNNYWKKEVSKASKQSYQKAVNGMPNSPTQGGKDGGGKTVKPDTASDPNPAAGYGKVLSEEELFDQQE